MTREPARSCHVIAGLNRAVGGPAVSVPSLAEALAARGAATAILTLDYPWEGPLPVVRQARLTAVRRRRWTRRLES